MGRSSVADSNDDSLADVSLRNLFVLLESASSNDSLINFDLALLQIIS